MKKIDLHIHTMSSISDSDFEFSLEAFKQYVTIRYLDVVAITNHNIFDSSQFHVIVNELPITVFPGIEIDVGSGHLLLIADTSDIVDFDTKCQQISGRIQSNTDSITVPVLKSIFGDLSQYLLIPHYEKSPKLKGSDFDQLRPYFSAGEVDSEKKFVRVHRDVNKLTPVLFSDTRIKEGLDALPTRATYLDCGDVTLPALKACLTDRNKVLLSESDGNKLFQVFDDGQHISTGLNVVLGERSSGKTHTLRRLNKTLENVKYIKQFELVQANEEDDEKEFQNDVQRRRSRFVDQYLTGFRSIVDDVSKVDTSMDNNELEIYVNSILKAGDEADRQDSFSRVKLYEENELTISDSEGLEKLIASVRHLIENIEYREVIESYVDLDSLKSLAIDLIDRLWAKSDDILIRGHVNTIIKDVKNALRVRTSAAHIENVDLYSVFMNKRKVKRFNEIVKYLQRDSIVFDEPIQGFRVVATKGPYAQASELKTTIKKQVALSESFRHYNNPYEYLQSLKENNKLDQSDVHKLFVNIGYRILNRDGVEVSGGERSEYRLLQAIQDAHKYDVLLLDEPESSFDNKFLDSEVNNLIRAIATEMPVVVVTHNNSVGASIAPDYVLYTSKKVENGQSSYRIYSGYPTDKELLCVDGNKVSNYEIILDALEAGSTAYEDRRVRYEAIKD